ncbi:MAG: hypothetical protein ACRD3M_07820 [Thermoanaerobaculia bacterium]
MRIAAIGNLLGLLSTAAFGQEPDARRLLSQAVAAQGSPEAIAAVKSLTAVADCTGPGGDYREFRTEVVSLRPDRTLFRQTAGGRTVEFVVVGEVGWRRRPETGAVEPLPEGMKGIVRGHEFHFLFLELDRRGQDPRLAGRDSVSGHLCLVVSMTEPGGRPSSVCLDEKTKLPLRLSFEPSGGPKPATIHVFPERWMEVAGIRWVEAFTLRQGEETFTYRYTTIRPNSVDPKIFQIPPEISRKS